jgi:cytidylate kinase
VKRYTPEERRDLADSAEKQMRQWTLRCQIAERLEDEKQVAKEAAELPKHLGPFITISREAGAGGGEIARLVGDALGLEVLDQSILDHMAETYQLPRGLVEFLDETRANWLHEVFGVWLNSRTVTQEAYVKRLGEMVLMAGQHGKVVFVGRGAQYFLPRNNGLAVRIVAPRKMRVERTMQMRNVGRDEAARLIATTDAGRADFVQRYFHHDVADPLGYDFVINVENLGLRGAAEHIVDMYRRRLPKRPPAA